MALLLLLWLRSVSQLFNHVLILIDWRANINKLHISDEKSNFAFEINDIELPKLVCAILFPIECHTWNFDLIRFDYVAVAAATTAPLPALNDYIFDCSVLLMVSNCYEHTHTHTSKLFCYLGWWDWQINNIAPGTTSVCIIIVIKRKCKSSSSPSSSWNNKIIIGWHSESSWKMWKLYTTDMETEWASKREGGRAPENIYWIFWEFEETFCVPFINNLQSIKIDDTAFKSGISFVAVVLLSQIQS